MKTVRRAPVISERQTVYVLTSIEATSPDPERDKAIIALSFYSGLRAKELAGIRICDLIDEAGELRNLAALPPEITKGSKFGEIAIAKEEARADIATYIHKRITLGGCPDQPLFLSAHHKRPMSADTMRQLLKSIFTRAGVKASSHSGRRTFATRLDMLGTSIRVIQSLMRHSSIHTTAIYIDATPERMIQAVSKL